MSVRSSIHFARNGNRAMAAVEAVPDAVFARVFSASTDHHLTRDGDLWTLSTVGRWQLTKWTLPRARDALRITHIGDEPRKRVRDKYLGPTPFSPQDIDSVVDVGAFIGEFAGRLNADVLAVEPDPRNAMCLRSNLSDDATVAEVAAWHSVDELSFASATDGSESGVGAVDGGVATRQEMSVRATTVTALCNKHGMEPDLIKIDAEGAEPEVVAGAIGVGAPIAVDVAAERRGDSPLSAVAALLRSHGFELTYDDGADVLFGEPGGDA